MPFLSLLVAACFATALEASDQQIDAAGVPLAELALDDECLDDGGGASCAMNALQHKALEHKASQSKVLHARAGEGSGGTIQDEAAPASPATHSSEVGGTDCTDCMSNNFQPGSEDLGSSRIWHYAQNCWSHCGEKAGLCDWCGPGNSCCRYKSPTDPPECQGTNFWPVLSYHTCVHGHTPSASQPSVPDLSQPSTAPVLTFYMYRAADDNNYPLENVNTASLAGVLWYLHNEVVVETPRKFGITRIQRIKVQTKATAPLFAKNMSFGVRQAFHSGKCTGPWQCTDQYRKYGYFVGCNDVGEFPTAKWAKKNHYKDAIWYSLPGPCSTNSYYEHTTSCVLSQPGGLCSGTPTGTGECTYSFEMAGEISVDELVGISNYGTFTGSGGVEYNATTDAGVGLSFWDGKGDDAKCAERVAAAEKLFVSKTGADDLPTPPCDFDYFVFFR